MATNNFYNNGSFNDEAILQISANKILKQGDKMHKNITLNEVKNSAFLAEQSYKSFEISPNSSKEIITNPATNSSFEVIDQINEKSKIFGVDTSGFS